MIDYVLTAAVGISAGVDALLSAMPELKDHRLLICIGILALLTLINMRGVHDTGVVFMIPTYLFLGTLLIVIGGGAWQVISTGGHPLPVSQIPPPPPQIEMIGVWIILKVFSSGCAAMTGIEAVSNGVMAFRDDARKNAKLALTIIIALLAVLLLGMALLCRAYGIAAVNPDSPHYESVLSILTRAVMGHGWFYYLTIASTLLVLALSANTAFADFPRLTRAIASHSFLPQVFLLRGRRLLYSWGIYVLVFLTATLLIVFDGKTDRLIPLYAIGAFLAFTLSQAGMVVHWRKAPHSERGRSIKMFVNGIGAFATGITTIVVLITKFTSGAWITALLIPSMMLIMRSVKAHYNRVNREIDLETPFCPCDVREPIVVMPIDRWSRISEKALLFAITLSSDVRCIHIQSGEESDPISNDWDHLIAEPLRKEGRPRPTLVTQRSPYRYILQPLVDYIISIAPVDEERRVLVLVPELVVRHWWQNLLHNQRANVLKVLLLVRGNRNIVVINMPWYLDRENEAPTTAKPVTPALEPHSGD
jgi:amino acid transporter